MPTQLIGFMALVLALTQPGSLESSLETITTQSNDAETVAIVNGASAADEVEDGALDAIESEVEPEPPTGSLNIEEDRPDTGTTQASTRTAAYATYLEAVTFADLGQLRAYPTRVTHPTPAGDPVHDLFLGELYGDLALESLPLPALPVPEDALTAIHKVFNTVLAVRSSVTLVGASATTGESDGTFGIYRLDEDDSWKQILLATNVAYVGQCLSDPDVLYAGIVDSIGAGSGEALVSFWRSNDAGDEWVEIPRSTVAINFPRFEFYVDPTNCDTVALYNGEGGYWKVSENSGSHFTCAEERLDCALGEQ